MIEIFILIVAIVIIYGIGELLFDDVRTVVYDTDEEYKMFKKEIEIFVEGEEE
mgnify:FL=1